ncbi:hypothetical protein VPNG_09005 [Cytospora leucostoma]|uniref:Uncharacterized protein n=1 Tax=Cytospora leucostoma TaxID=1230097 RepID=A0A423VZW7_9PEZI|nr:hypothetical protein VPNG_09005 [Cytospora leucostoma]
MRDHLPPLSMVPSLYEVGTAIRSRMIGWNVVSNSTSWVVQLISWFFITLALSLFLPLAGLVIFDFFLWLWRLARPPTPTTTKTPRGNRRRESLSHPVTTS